MYLHVYCEQEWSCFDFSYTCYFIFLYGGQEKIFYLMMCAVREAFAYFIINLNNIIIINVANLHLLLTSIFLHGELYKGWLCCWWFKNLKEIFELSLLFFFFLLHFISFTKIPLLNKSVIWDLRKPILGWDRCTTAGIYINHLF